MLALCLVKTLRKKYSHFNDKKEAMLAPSTNRPTTRDFSLLGFGCHNIGRLILFSVAVRLAFLGSRQITVSSH